MKMNNAQTDRTGGWKKAEWRRLTGYNRVLVGLCETNKSIMVSAEKKGGKHGSLSLKKCQQKLILRPKSDEILLLGKKCLKLAQSILCGLQKIFF